MKKTELKLGIIGGGALTRVFYLPILKRLGHIPCLLIDPVANQIKTLATEYGIAETAESIEHSVQSADYLIIATPNYLHFPQARNLLEKRKHVLLEKPIASTGDEVMELIKVSAKSGSVLQPAMMRRFWKINRAVKKMMEEELLGKIRSISMKEGAVMNWPVQSVSVFNPEHSLGGVLMDTGSHTLDLLCWWIGEQHFELKYEDDNRGGVEADCRLDILFTESDLRAEVELSRIRNMPNEFTLTGTKGWIKLKPYTNFFKTSSRQIDKFIYNLYPRLELENQGIEDLFLEQLSSWLKAAQSGAQPEINARNVLPSIQIIEQAYINRKLLRYAWD